MTVPFPPLVFGVDADETFFLFSGCVDLVCKKEVFLSLSSRIR